MLALGRAIWFTILFALCLLPALLSYIPTSLSSSSKKLINYARITCILFFWNTQFVTLQLIGRHSSTIRSFRAACQPRKCILQHFILNARLFQISPPPPSTVYKVLSSAAQCDSTCPYSAPLLCVCMLALGRAMWFTILFALCLLPACIITCTQIEYNRLKKSLYVDARIPYILLL